MTSRSLTLLATALLLVWGRAAAAQITVTPVSLGTLTISVPPAGSDVSPATNSAGTYTVKTKNKDPNVRIQARLTAPLPAGETLEVSLTAPAGATSMGSVILNASTPVDVVVAIRGRTNGTGLPITYTFSAPVSSGNSAGTFVTVVFTLSP